MITAVHRSFSASPATTQAWLLALIEEEFTPLLQVSPPIPAERWARAVAAADPVFFLTNDGDQLMHLGAASHQRLLDALQQEFDRPVR